MPANTNLPPGQVLDAALTEPGILPHLLGSPPPETCHLPPGACSDVQSPTKTQTSEEALSPGSVSPRTGGNRESCLALYSQLTKIRQHLKFRAVAEESSEKSVPPATRAVTCACEVLLIRDVNPVNATYTCRFNIFLEWLDKGAVGLPHGPVPEDKRKSIGIPEIALQNALAANREVHSAPEVVCSTTGHVSLKIMFQAIMQMDLDMRLFPFDSQRLSLILGLRARRDRDRLVQCQFCHISPQIRLEEWQLLEPFAKATRPDGRARVEFGIAIGRRFWYYVVNVLLTLVIITALAVMGIMLDEASLFDRLRFGVVILFAQTTFRLSIENKLPKVAYATFFDRYAMMCLLACFGVITCNVAVAILGRRSEDGKDFASKLDKVSYIAIFGLWALWTLMSTFCVARDRATSSAGLSGESPKHSILGKNSHDDDEEECDATEAVYEQIETIKKNLRFTGGDLESRPLQPATRAVSVSTCVWLLHDVDPISATFECKFTVYLEWIDDGAIGLSEGDRLTPEQAQRFHAPNVAIHNAVESVLEDGPTGHVVCAERGLLGLRCRYHARMQVHMDLQHFPFDSQRLPVQLSMPDESDQDCSFVLGKCTIASSAQELDEWIVRGVDAHAALLDGADIATFEVLVSRRSNYYMVSLFAVLFGITSILFGLFAINAHDVDAFEDQGKIALPLLMTLLMFKFSIAEKLPKVAKSTVFDRYVLVCQAVFLMIGAVIFVAKILVNQHVQRHFVDTLYSYGSIGLGAFWVTCNIWLLLEWHGGLAHSQLSSGTQALPRRRSVNFEAQRSRLAAQALADCRLTSVAVANSVVEQFTSAVYARIDVKHIHSVNPTSGTFFCDFIVKLCWLDEAARNLPTGMQLPRNWSGKTHQPYLMVQNALQVNTKHLTNGCVVLCGSRGIVGYKMQVRARLQISFHLAHFPFDEQVLAVVFALPDIGDRSRHLCIDCTNASEAVRIGEWSVHNSFTAEGKSKGTPHAAFGVRIQRSSRYYVQHMANIGLFSTFTLVVHAMKTEKFADRGKVLVGVLLVQVVAKLSVGNKLPRIARTTAFDRFALNCLALLFTTFGSTALCNILGRQQMWGLSFDSVGHIDLALGGTWLLAWLVANLHIITRSLYEVHKAQTRHASEVPEQYRWAATQPPLPASVAMEQATLREAMQRIETDRDAFAGNSCLLKDAGAASSHEAPPSNRIPIKPARDQKIQNQGLAVSLGVKIREVSGIDASSSTFECKFHVFMEWLDEAAAGLPEGQRISCESSKGREGGKGRGDSDTDEPVLDMPRISVRNAISIISEDCSDPEVVNSETGHVTCWKKYHVRVYTEFDLRCFPFDCQQLDVALVVEPHRNGSERFFVAGFCDAADEVGLENWRLVRVSMNRHSRYGPAYASVCILVQRDWWYYVVGVMTILFWTTTLAFSFFLLQPTEMGNRFIDTLKIVLTQTTFRFSVEPRLPKVPHWTPFDLYLVSCQVLFLLIGISHILVELQVQQPDGFCKARRMNYSLSYPLMSAWLIWNFSFAAYAFLIHRRELRKALVANALAFASHSLEVSSFDTCKPSAIRAAKESMPPLDGACSEDLQLISIAFRIWLVRNIDPIKGTFDCKFRIFLEWLDVNAKGLEKGKKVSLPVPSISITNATNSKVLDKSSNPEVVSSETGHLAAQILFQATLKMDHEVQFFPFDCQWLMINVSLREGVERNRSFLYQYCEIEGQLKFDEWTVCQQPAFSCVTKDNSENIQDTVQCGVIIRRCPRYYVVNIISMLCLITLLSFSPIAIISDNSSTEFWMRAEVFLGIFPLIVIFKLSVQARLPRVSYSTWFDKYANWAFRLFMFIVAYAVGGSSVSVVSTWHTDTDCFNSLGDDKAHDEEAEFVRQIELYLAVVLAVLWIGYNIRFAVDAFRVQWTHPAKVLQTSAPLRLQNEHITTNKAVEPLTPTMSALSSGTSEMGISEGSESSDFPSLSRMESTLARRCTVKASENWDAAWEFEDHLTPKRRSSNKRLSDYSGKSSVRSSVRSSIRSSKNSGISRDSWFGLPFSRSCSEERSRENSD